MPNPITNISIANIAMTGTVCMIFAKVMITPDNFPNRAIMMPKGIPIIDANNTPYTDIRND